MTKIDKIVAAMRESPTNVRFNDLAKVCDHYFGQPRQQGTSHQIIKRSGREIRESTFNRAKAVKPKPIR